MRNDVTDKREVGGTRWHSWLRQCATSPKIAGSIPNGIIATFHWHKPSGRTMYLGSTQPLTEMSTRNIYWRDNGGRGVWLTNLPPASTGCLESWEPQPPGTLRVCPGLQWDCFMLPLGVNCYLYKIQYVEYVDIQGHRQQTLKILTYD